MPKEHNYSELEKIKKTIRIRNLLKEMPDFMSEYIRGKSETTSVNTRLVYTYDLRIFFRFLIDECNGFENKNLKNLDLDDLNKTTAEHIESFMEYLSYYEAEDENGNVIHRQNKARGKARKLAAIKTMYKYFHRKRKLKTNVSELVDMPKISNKAVIRLEQKEVQKMLDEIENGANLTAGEKNFHEHTKIRDMAIIILFLGTGIRISECVGINLEDIDFNIDGIRIIRKGGDEAIIYFGKEVSKALNDYLLVREKIVPLKGNENAFFLSIQNRRITTRAVQNLVKKYSRIISGFKNISPHKLRSTYGTNLYRATGDIYLVADVLGHKDINTTRKHYVKMDEERRREAVDFIKIREDVDEQIE